MAERRLCTVYIPGPDGQYGTTVSAASAFEAARAAIAWFSDPFWNGPKPRTGTILTIGAMGIRGDIRVSVRQEWLRPVK